MLALSLVVKHHRFAVFAKKVLSTVISCCLVDLKLDVVSKIQKMDTSFIGLTPNHEVSWLTLVNAS